MLLSNNLSKREKLMIRAFVIAVFVLAAAAVFVNTYAGKAENGFAVVEHEGKVILRQPLSRDGEFSSPELPNMKFLIENGRVKVSESDCPDKICMKTGFISLSAQSAVCLPNKAVLYVEYTNE